MRSNRACTVERATLNRRANRDTEVEESAASAISIF